MEQQATSTAYQSRFGKLAAKSWNTDGTFNAVIPLEFTNAIRGEIDRRSEAAFIYIVKALDRSFADLLKEFMDSNDEDATSGALLKLFAYNDAIMQAHEYCDEAIRRIVAVDRAMFPPLATGAAATASAAATDSTT